MPTPPAENRQSGLLVLGKITQLLNAFSLAQPEMSLRELQEATGLPASTVQRLVANMVNAGFLDRHGERLRVGFRMAYWAAAAMKDYDPLTVIRPVLTELRDRTGETATFFVRESHQRVCIAIAQTRHALRREMHVGKVLPLTVGSAGRVLLAWTPDLAVRDLETGLPRVTEHSITDPSELEQAVAQTRSEGFAITVGEREDAASGLSAPVFDAAGDLVGALMIHGPTLRMTQPRCEEFVDDLVEHAERITRTLGGQPPR